MEPQSTSDKPSELKAEGAYKYLQPYKSKKGIMADNFLGGLFWAFGTVVGLSIIALIAGFIIARIDLIPIIGGWLSQIVNEATQNIQLPINSR